MLSRLIELLQLLVRLVELDATSRCEEKSAPFQGPDYQALETSVDRMDRLENQPRPLALQAPVQAGKPEASSTMPKKRGRPPKVNRTEDSSNS